MRIGLIVMELGFGGGGEHYAINLSLGLKRAGHHPVIVTADARLSEPLVAEGIPVLKHPVDRRSPARLWSNSHWLAGVAEDQGLEVFNPTGIFPAITAHWARNHLLRKGKAVPNIVTIHNLSKLTWSYYKLGATLLNHYADHIIFESQCELNRLRKRGFRNRYTLLPSGTPPCKQSEVTESREEIRRDLGIPHDTVLFLMPARMTEEKRHDLLLETLARREVRSLPIRFYLAGDGPLMEGYMRRAEELGVSHLVVFGGYRRDLPRLYAAADAFFLCSSMESMPVSIREGMAASLPVVATDVGGTAEMVEDGENGLLAPSGDSAALGRAIGRLATDADLRRRMGLRGKEIYQDRFEYQSWITRSVAAMACVRENFIVRHSASHGPFELAAKTIVDR